MIRLFGRKKKTKGKRRVSKKAKKKVRKVSKIVKKTRARRVKTKHKKSRGTVRKVKKERIVKRKKVKPKRVRRVREVKIVRKIEPKAVVKPVINKMPDENAYTLLKRYRISTVPYSFCKDGKQLSKALKKIGFPCVMKVSGDIIHKTDVNGVRLNVKNEEEAVKTFSELMKIKGCKRVLVQKMITDAYEIIVGGKRDLQFNGIVALGAGGTFAEILKDVSFRIAPLGRRDAEEMLSEVKFSSLLLEGFRGKGPVNKDSIIDVILAVSRIMERNKKIKELDINPLFVTTKKSFAVDVRIILQ